MLSVLVHPHQTTAWTRTATKMKLLARGDRTVDLVAALNKDVWALPYANAVEAILVHSLYLRQGALGADGRLVCHEWTLCPLTCLQQPRPSRFTLVHTFASPAVELRGKLEEAARELDEQCAVDMVEAVERRKMYGTISRAMLRLKEKRQQAGNAGAQADAVLQPR